ncbi:MAG TPA: NADH-quinone oxidoreductase subunit C [Telluria sp.]|nr:NADH-quinone oxidoreductase subunit C [Telluria sp.]
MERFRIDAQQLPGGVPAWTAQVDGGAWLRVARAVREEGARLAALWAAPGCASVAYALAEGLLWLRMPVEEGYPSLDEFFPAAERMERAAWEISGVRALGAHDRRPWLNHGNWPRDYVPLRDVETPPRTTPDSEYPFVQVAGEGVHEIAVGPIHAGIIEPGHFRFSVVGEKVLRLEERLGYVHKGIERLFAGRALADGARLAGRVSGDTTVAYAWAYAMAAESVTGCRPPTRALWLRALLLERERIANHLGDLGALGNDAGLAVGLAQFMRLKEDWVRLSGRLFGHRYAMDTVVPGGVAVDLDDAGRAALLDQCAALEGEVGALRGIYEEHAGLQDRFIGAGRVTPQLAAQLGLCGLAGRASGQAWDARCDQAGTPYDVLDPGMATHRNGDVAARVTVRFEEIAESLRLLRRICAQLPPGPVAALLPPAGAGRGLGWIEGWRGPVLVALETGADGAIARCHCHDPSWQNWPVLQHAIMGNIVPDFPLINKSFNLSYAGHDL